MNELVMTGDVYDCYEKERPGKYMGLFIFNADRSRFNQGGYDWGSMPVDTGPPLSEVHDVIATNMPNPVVVDLDGDGLQEIVYPSYDGRVHAFWLDKTEHHNWPYSVYDPNEGFYRFASEPVVADLDNDGQAEVIFSSWVQQGIPRHGRLHILDYQGNPLHEIDLPPGYGYDWNGGMAAPTLADIDGDPDLEVVLNTDAAGVVAYDLPGTANARILWGTGRWNYQRTGSLATGTLASSRLSVSPHSLRSGEVMTYTIQLVNPGPVLSSVRVTDTLAAEVHFLGDLWASSGISGQAENPYQPDQTVITWSGPVSSDAPVTISFGVEVKEEITTAQSIVNTALLDDGQGRILQVQATAVVIDGHGIYLPSVRRQ